MELVKQLAGELSLREDKVAAVVKLIDEGNTIPFIARYRKEVTGSMEDTALRELEDRLKYLRNLEKRKEEVLSSIGEQGKLTPELEESIAAAQTLAVVEDLYRPYKQKRRTRASVAREKGLEPLAAAIRAQSTLVEPLMLAKDYLDPEKGVESPEAALQGALDILAEDISDDADIRGELRRLIQAEGLVVSAAAQKQGEAESGPYAMYADFSEAVGRIASHRVLAISRGVKEGLLKAAIQLPEERAVGLICRRVVTAKNPCARAVEEAVRDSWKRLIAPSMENETFSTLFEAASEQAIKVFGENLHHLLMQPPVKDRVVLGLDPGYRNGCKLAVVDGTGKVLDTAVIYPTQPYNRVEEAKRKLTALIRKHKVTVISIGNGTASRESEGLVAELIRELGPQHQPALSYMMVSEAGASVYSASKLASEEFPQFDVNLRSAVSIARRLQDPLAELVKIDPKAIGVGQYQHDMPPARLESALGGVVESCVNSVGVDLNTASGPLLGHVAGLSAAVAKNIVAYREENGSFTARSQLLKETYEQCAGFLRILGAKNPLDATAVHPESYAAAKSLLEECGWSLADVGTPALRELPAQAEGKGIPALAQRLGVGEPTIRDIISELLKPGRDPREELPPPLLRTDVMELKDLVPEMVLTGTVRNVLDFGAFVDIGVHEDGLVHISQLADKFVKHPSQVVKVGDVVKVKVLEVDAKRKRISLTMKGLN